MSKTLILCDCLGSQKVDRDALAEATGLACSKVHSELCGAEAGRAAEAMAGGEAVICCGQETAFFEALADEVEAPMPAFLDLRDRAGWTSDSAPTLPKMSALVAEASLRAPAEKAVDVVSDGLCLIIGAGEVALNAAEQLKEHLSVTLLLPEPPEGPLSRGFDVVAGQLRRAEGAFGQFRVTIDGFSQPTLGGRGDLAFSTPRNGALSECDVILDLSGGPALFPAPEKRDGYLRADPKSQPAVAAAVLGASHLVGTFEKPLYVQTQAHLCAHSRAGQTGCTRCLDACPTGAITPDGDHVSIDPMICAGCGACASLCPSGSITYDAPATDHTFRRIQTLASAYLDAGGVAPRLLVVDAHGAEMIGLAARYGDGLPADVIPLEVGALNTIGHAEVLAGLAAGFADVSLVMSPSVDREVTEREMALAWALGGKAAVVLDVGTPDALTAALYEGARATPLATPVRPAGTRRQITRTAAKALTPEGGQLPLPEGAPYGAVLVNTDACTLCLSCISLCPSGALVDNPDLPQLRFQEEACLQCGVCNSVCPENAITYEPRLNLDNNALEQVVLNEEEPFACIECGKLFGVKSTIEKITEKLAGKHDMFANPQAARMIQMCEDCRVSAQFHSENNPFAGGDRPRPRTTEDYFSKRRDH